MGTRVRECWNGTNGWRSFLKFAWSRHGQLQMPACLPLCCWLGLLEAGAENFSALAAKVTLLVEAVDIKCPTAHLPRPGPFPVPSPFLFSASFPLPLVFSSPGFQCCCFWRALRTMALGRSKSLIPQTAKT